MSSEGVEVVGRALSADLNNTLNNGNISTYFPKAFPRTAAKLLISARPPVTDRNFLTASAAAFGLFFREFDLSRNENSSVPQELVMIKQKLVMIKRKLVLINRMNKTNRAATKSIAARIKTNFLLIMTNRAATKTNAPPNMINFLLIMTNTAWIKTNFEKTMTNF
jgi:hypothetical protein